MLAALWRPWIGLIVLLAVLPFNGLISQVVPGLADLTPTAETALAAWHDAIVAGIALAAVIAWLRQPRRPTLLESIIVVMLAVGALYVVVSPVRLTALYAYRTLYEPAVLLLAIVVLARTRGLPERLVGTAATAFVSAASAAALFTWLQVYVLGFHYLNVFYTVPGQPLHWSYLATGLNQPRGIGTLTSPNEFGAVLAIAMILLAVPNLVRAPGWVRTWLFVACALGLLLSFSRSGMLAAAVGLIVVAFLTRHQWLRPLPKDLTARRILSFLTPVVVGLALTTLVFNTSGAAVLVQETVQGSEPSAQGRPASVRQGITIVLSNPLGLGLGTAGPKAIRFGESAGANRILTEMWYLVYAIQVGVIGLALLIATALVIFVGLWRSRASPISRGAIAMGFGLGAGALFIPILDEPTVFIPLWAFSGLALATAAVRVSSVERPVTVHQGVQPTRRDQVTT